MGRVGNKKNYWETRREGTIVRPGCIERIILK
jgi:hypothetical protein